ncbi:MAG: helix-hairpin-helix domain-containing protein [Phycisphaerae bacterium]|nr:helix-hairpin-helix domain-containing protein [Phycisphaerae bacterium]
MNSRSRRPAAVLILVLWAIAILSLLAGGLCFAIRQNLAIANIERDRLIGHWLARAGVERAIAEIMDDTDPADTLDDRWADNPDALQEIELTGGTFSVPRDGFEAVPQAWYGAGDESAKLNLNVATREQLMKLRHMTDPITGAIIDWRDRNAEPELDGIEGGYYAGLGHPYNIRNGPFRTVRELLLVRGVTPELFYGEDLNANGTLDPNEDDGGASEPPDNADGRLDRGWYAYVTTYSYDENVNANGQKRINVNSASASEFSSRLFLEQWAAESIVKARQEQEFEHLADLLDVRRAPSIARGDASSDYYARSEDEEDQPITTSIFEQLVDDLTLTDQKFLVGRINVNTAPLEVLETLPGVDSETASAIVRERDAMAGFSSIGQLLRVSGITKDEFAELESFVTVRAKVFRIQSHGQAASGFAQATIECIVERRDDEPRVLYWLESSP